MPVIYQRTTCRLCGDRRLACVLPLAASPIGDAYVSREELAAAQERYPVDLYLCRACGHAQLGHVIDPEVLYRDYLYVTNSSLGLVEHFERYAEEVLRSVAPPAGSLVIDVGSNDGALLRAFKQHGLRVLGVDPARQIAVAATAAGIETLPDYLTQELARSIRSTHGPAALVTANNVFANVDDLAAFTEAVRALLAPDGVFVFEVFYLADLIRNMVFDFIYHEHLDYHSIKPLHAFFQRHGMALIGVQRVPVKCGSIRCTVQLAGGSRPVSPSVAAHLAEESQMGLHEPALFETFAAKIDAAHRQVIALVRQLQAQGKTIAGYGASVTATALIYQFGLGDALSFLLDDNPAKQHRFSPGLHLPVLQAQALYERKPEVVMILAWRYAQPILKQHQRYLEKGGQVIVPLPVMQVLTGQPLALASP